MSCAPQGGRCWECGQESENPAAAGWYPLAGNCNEWLCPACDEVVS